MSVTHSMKQTCTCKVEIFQQSTVTDHFVAFFGRPLFPPVDFFLGLAFFASAHQSAVCQY